MFSRQKKFVSYISIHKTKMYKIFKLIRYYLSFLTRSFYYSLFYSYEDYTDRKLFHSES